MKDGKTVIAATERVAFSTSSRAMFGTKSVTRITYITDKVLTTTPGYFLTTNTQRVYFKVSLAKKFATPSSSLRTCLGLLIILFYINF